MFLRVYLTGAQSPQSLVQKLRWTQSDHRHQVTWTATILMSGGCTEWGSLRVLRMQYYWMPLRSVGWPGLRGWSHSWAWVTLCRWRHDNSNLPWDEYWKVVVGYPGRDLVIASFILSANNILEEGPGYNSKQEYHDCTNHHFVRQNPAHPIPWQAGLPCLHHHRQHTKAHSTKAFSTRPSLTGVSPNIKTWSYHK